MAAPGRPVPCAASTDRNRLRLLLRRLLRPTPNSIFVADTDYLESDDTREVEGVYYPEWGEGAFTLQFEWEPLMFAISDGADSDRWPYSPRTRRHLEEATYTVDGIYAYAAEGEPRNARLYFRDGVLRQVFGFTGQSATGSPREIITPRRGTPLPC